MASQVQGQKPARSGGDPYGALVPQMRSNGPMGIGGDRGINGLRWGRGGGIEMPRLPFGLMLPQRQGGAGGRPQPRRSGIGGGVATGQITETNPHRFDALNDSLTNAEGEFAMPRLDPTQLGDQQGPRGAFRNAGKFPRGVGDPSRLLDGLDIPPAFGGMGGRFGGGGDPFGGMGGMGGLRGFIDALRRMSRDLSGGGNGPFSGR